MADVTRHLLATMITTTTYGTWPPGDLRGYVDDGKILPGDPTLLAKARSYMTGAPVYLSAAQQNITFAALCTAATEFHYTLLAASIESWHVHALVVHGYDDVAKVAGRLKARMRQALNMGRVWTTGYDKRYCFTEREVDARRQYINRHAGARAIR